MKRRILWGITCLISFAAVSAFVNAHQTHISDPALLANVEALTEDEPGGNICTAGCRVIGWGWDKILKCNCSYTGTFSSCDQWGCVL